MTTPPDGPWTPPPPRAGGGPPHDGGQPPGYGAPQNGRQPPSGGGNRTLILAIVAVLVVAAAVIVAIVVSSGGNDKASTAAKSATTSAATGGSGTGSAATGAPSSAAFSGTGNPDAFTSCGDLVKRLGTSASKLKVSSGGSVPAAVPLPATKPSAICTAKGGTATDTFLSWRTVTKASYDAQLTQAGWKHTTVSSYPFVTTLWVKPGSKYEIITFTDGNHLVAFYGPPAA